MNERMLIGTVAILLCALLLAGVALAMESDNYQLDWFTPLTGNGGGPADSNSYAANVTIGQTAVGESSGGNYEACLGYWCQEESVQECVGLRGVTVQGPTSGYTDTLYALGAVITPTDATEPITYTWSPEPESGQGTAEAQYRWSASGSYSLTLTAENCGGSDTDTHTITIQAPSPGCPRPLASAAISGPDSGNVDTPYVFTADLTPTDATEPITYTWSPEPESGQGTAEAQYRWSASGSYSLTLTAENCGGSDTAVRVVDVQAGEHYYIYLPAVMRD